MLQIFVIHPREISKWEIDPMGKLHFQRCHIFHKIQNAHAHEMHIASFLRIGAPGQLWDAKDAKLRY